MISYIKNKLKKRRQKRTFQEYGYEINTFDIGDYGTMKYAQWLHPGEGKKSFSSANIAFYKQFLKEGDVAIDIGAHTGDTTVPMAIAAGSTGRVLAFEPNPYVFKILEKNASLNPKLANITTECYAATEEEGKFIFNYSDASFCNGGFSSEIERNNHHHNYELEIQGKNLQKELKKHYSDLLPKLSLIKVDAEGYDKDILMTIQDVINEFRPSLLVECYKRLTKNERSELYQVITQNDYHLYKFEDFNINVDPVRIYENDMNNWQHFEMMAIPAEKDKKE